jgi:hypothetical protein
MHGQHHGDLARLLRAASPREEAAHITRAAAASGARLHLDGLKTAVEQHRKSHLLSFTAQFGSSTESLESSISHLSADAWEIPDDPPHGPMGLLGVRTAGPGFESQEHLQQLRPGVGPPVDLLTLARLLENQRRSEEAQRQQALQTLQLQLLLSHQTQLQAQARLPPLQSAASHKAALPIDGNVPSVAALSGEQPSKDPKFCLAPELKQSIVDFLGDYKQLVAKSCVTAERSPKRRRNSPVDGV